MGRFGSRDQRTFNRQLVVNRWHLFRKNFRVRPLSVLGFAWMVAVLVAHRAVNRDWAGIRGLAEGTVAAARAGWRTPT